MSRRSAPTVLQNLPSAEKVLDPSTGELVYPDQMSVVGRVLFAAAQEVRNRAEKRKL